MSKKEPTLHKNTNPTLIRIIKVTLRSAWISILIILILTLLMTMMEQGTALLVSLLASPWSFLMFMILTGALALVVGHYPIYLMKWQRDHSPFKSGSKSKNGIKWNMALGLGGVGVIEFKEEEDDEEEQLKKSDKRVIDGFNFMRGLLGIIFIQALTIVVLSAYTAYIDSDFPLRTIVILLFLFFGSIHLYIFYRKDELLKNKKKLMFGLYNVLFVLTTTTFLATWITTFNSHGVWESVTVWLLCGSLFLGNLFYIWFKNFRSSGQDKEESPCIIFPLSLLSDHIKFILFNTILGYAALVIFIMSQIYDVIHPLVVLLAFLHLLYGAIVITLKHRIYYLSKHYEKGERRRRFFTHILPALPILLLIWVVFSTNMGNELHTLPPVEKGEVVSLDSYKEQFIEHMRSLAPKDSTMYFISSYGGGLKANAWNLFVLDTLTNFRGKNILNQTVAMSGVSGGCLGQHFYASIYKQGLDREGRRDIIHSISKANMLTRDLAWLLGFDLIRELVPYASFNQRDRAGAAMEKYAKLLNDERIMSIPYQAYWAEIIKDRHYPIQIVNAAGTHHRRGIACSVDIDTFKKVFPNSDNLLDLPDSATLSYADAVSCSHRFPLFSPSAKVQTKGHYLDGGYYENSGMLSLVDLYKYLMQDTTFRAEFNDWKVVFLQVRNDRSEYLRSKINREDLKITETRESGEILAILRTVSSIKHLPLYIEDNLKCTENIEYRTIDLPYTLDEKTIKKALRVKQFDCSSQDELERKIDEVNREIKQALINVENYKWTTIEPPLARYLSVPAVNYMETMLKNDSTIFNNLLHK